MADLEPRDPPDTSPDTSPEGHGTYGAQRADGKGDHDPEPAANAEAPDAEDWADRTQRGGAAAS